MCPVERADVLSHNGLAHMRLNTATPTRIPAGTLSSDLVTLFVKQSGIQAEDPTFVIAHGVIVACMMVFWIAILIYIMRANCWEHPTIGCF
jgi:hypothetical protein